MRLRTKYILFVTLLHVVTLVLSYFIFRENKILFIASELIILISLVISWQLYKELISPLNALMTGVEAIKAKDFNVKFLETGKFEMDQLINVYNQMIDQLREERTRQEEQHFFLQKLVQTSPTGIIILDHDGKAQQVNPRACELLAVEEKALLQKEMGELQHPVLQQMRDLPSGTSKTFSPGGITTYKISKSHFIDRGFARSFIMIEELTAEILAAEKNAYGKVIRMMAHEVNNTIGPVNSIVQTTLNSNDLWQQQQHDQLKQALQVAVDRNSNLNLFMRNFADVVRLPQPAKKQVDLKVLLQNVATLMKMNTVKRQVALNLHLNNSPILVHADPQQLEQAFINIIKNAMEAIDETGEVSITTTLHPKQVVIANNGNPIEENVAQQLFSPFFSTKRDGQGVGLTLVKEILHNHHYRFSLQTYRDGITRFVVEVG